jgi:hypothetical protein
MAAPAVQIPSVDRYTVANLPQQAAKGSIAIVTDGSATPSQTGIVPVGGGSLENMVWFDGLVSGNSQGTWWVV